VSAPMSGARVAAASMDVFDSVRFDIESFVSTLLPIPFLRRRRRHVAERFDRNPVVVSWRGRLANRAGKSVGQ